MLLVSNIAATGMYDPFTLGYAGWMFNIFNIPMTMMPRIVDSAGDHFGSTKQGKVILGKPSLKRV